MADKKHFRLFVSHATTDDALVTDFFNGISGHLKDNVGLGVDFRIDHTNVLRNASLFHPELMKELEDSDGAVFCISSDALNSKSIAEHELSTMFLRFLDGGFPLCIVLLRNYEVSNHEALKHLQHIVVQTHELYPQYAGEKKGTKPLNFAKVLSEKRKPHGLLDANDLDEYFVTVAGIIRSYLLGSHPPIPSSKEAEAICAWALQKKKEGDAKTNKNDDISPTNPNKDMKNKLHALITALNYAGFFREADKLELDGSARANLNRLKLSFNQKTHEKDDFYSQRLELWVDSLEK